MKTLLARNSHLVVNSQVQYNIYSLLFSCMPVLAITLAVSSSLTGNALIRRMADWNWVTGSTAPDELVASVEFDFDGFAHFQGTDGGPDASFAFQCPFCHVFSGWLLEKLADVFEREIGHEGKVRTWDCLID